ncbi:MAG: response regulator transcription factor [Flavobacteriaceae bacterium]
MKDNLFTKRELDVLIAYSKGLSHQKTADELNISLFTFRTHWRNIKNKSNIKNIADVIRYVNKFHN